MTSKNSSTKLLFKLIKQDIIKRIWCPIVIFIAYFFFFDLRILMTLDDMKRVPENYTYDVPFFFADNIFGTSISYNIFLVCGIAFVCALSAFSYLHSKAQVDAYHSLPVSRVKIFASKVISDLLIFIVPFIIHIFIAIGISVSNNAFSMHEVANAVNYILVSLIYFLLVYTVSVIAICLTGNIIVSVISIGIFWGYSVILQYAKITTFSSFFLSYYNPNYDDKLWSFSPAGILINSVNDIDFSIYRSNLPFDYSVLYAYVPSIIIYTVIALAIAVFVYKIRPSEAAGSAIAFVQTEPIIKTALLIPFSLIGGGFLHDTMRDDYNFKWYIFGTIICFVLLCLTIEIIFRMDIRGAFKHKLQFAINAALIIAITLIFKLDLFGYETYIPAEKQISSYSVALAGIYSNSIVEPSESEYYQKYIGNCDYQLENVFIHDNSSVPVLIQKALSERVSYKSMDDIYSTDDDSFNYNEFIIGYNLNNGKRIFRRYYINSKDEQTLALIADVFNDASYKEGALPIFNLKYTDKAKYVAYRFNGKNCESELSEEQKKELIDAYTKDYLELSFNDFSHQLPIGAFGLKGNKMHEWDYYNTDIDNACYIYPQFSNTLKWFKDNGIEYESAFDYSTVSRVVITKYERTQNSVTEESEFIEYTSPEQIKEILDNSVNDNFAYSSQIVYNSMVEHDINIAVYQGNDSFGNLFVKDKVPAFVLSDLSK